MWKMHFSFVCLNELGVSGKYHPDWIKLSYKPKLLHACISGQETKQIISENQIVKIRSGTQTVNKDQEIELSISIFLLFSFRCNVNRNEIEIIWDFS